MYSSVVPDPDVPVVHAGLLEVEVANVCPASPARLPRRWLSNWIRTDRGDATLRFALNGVWVGNALVERRGCSSEAGRYR